MLIFIKFLAKKGIGNFWRELNKLKKKEKKSRKGGYIEFDSLRKSKLLDQWAPSTESELSLPRDVTLLSKEQWCVTISGN